MTVPTPEGYAAVASWVISPDTEAELGFLAAVFGAVETPGSRIMTDGRVNHVEVDLAGTAVMLFDAAPGWAPTPAHTRIYVADLPATVDSAVARGARLVTEPRELPSGDVVARFRDPQEALDHVGRTLIEEFDRT